MPDLAQFLDWRVATYLIGIIACQMACWVFFIVKRKRVSAARLKVGLPPEIMLNNTVKLEEFRKDNLIQSVVLLLSVVLLPLLLSKIGVSGSSKNATGLGLTFLILLFWVFFNVTDVSKAYLGGLTFKTLAAFKVPFQVGDRVAFEGAAGKVVSFDTFYTTLQTPDDDKISVPTVTLWNSVITSVNGSSKSSLCVMNFYLSSQVTVEQRTESENQIWDAIQASVYFDVTQPMQIYLKQNPEYICITAKAYVASTYKEPEFVSDVTRSFLDFASKEGLLPERR